MNTFTDEIIFPCFTIENQATIQSWLTPEEMGDTLTKGGFTVVKVFGGKRLSTRQKTIAPPTRDIRFHVKLPADWSLFFGHDSYGCINCTQLHIVDQKHRLRGHINLDKKYGWRTMSAMLYCRYVPNPYDGVYNGEIIGVADNGTLDVVIDRAEVNRELPHDFHAVVHCAVKKAKWDLRQIPPVIAEFLRLPQRYVIRTKMGTPALECPVYAWLHENYPNWQDPFAYW